MKEQDIFYITQLLHENTGVSLTKEKVYLLEARLQPIIESYSISSFSELVSRLKTDQDKILKRSVIEALMTTETYFFRDTSPFEQFSSVMIPYLTKAREQTKTIRIWSAGCSTGQEAYSITLSFLEKHQDIIDWHFEILATDISTQVLEKAREGIFNQFEIQRGLPIQLLVKYFEKDDQKWKIKNVVKSFIKFQQFNLLDNPLLLGKFDIIFCRNVLIYFDIESKRKVLTGISKILQPDGFLVLGGSETTIGVSDLYVPLPESRGIYVRADTSHQNAIEKKILA